MGTEGQKPEDAGKAVDREESSQSAHLRGKCGTPFLILLDCVSQSLVASPGSLYIYS